MSKEDLSLYDWMLTKIGVHGTSKELAQKLKEKFEETNAALLRELEELKAWKREEMAIWLPLLIYMHDECPDLILGESISEKALEFIKDRMAIKKALQYERELIEKCVSVLSEHILPESQLSDTEALSSLYGLLDNEEFVLTIRKHDQLLKGNVPLLTAEEEILEERFGLWKKKLMAEGAIPEVLIGVNLVNNKIILCIPEKMPDKMALGLLLGVAGVIEQNLKGHRG